MAQGNKLLDTPAGHGDLAEVTPTTEEALQETAFPSNLLVSKQQVFLAFSAVAFPIFSWAILQYLNRVTAWLYYLTIWEVMSLLAYTLLFALVESMVITAGFVTLAALLPESLFRQKFVPLTMAMIIPLTLGAILVHYLENTLRVASLSVLGGAFIVYALFAVSLYLIVLRVAIVADRFRQIAERVSVLVYLYLPLSLVGLTVVIVRNF